MEEGLWARRLKGLLERQQYVLSGISRDADGLGSRVKAISEDLLKLEAEAEGFRESLRKELDALDPMREDPVVVVRVYGKYCDVYHSVVRPCGWVPRSAIREAPGSGYVKYLLGEAKARGKRPCRSCGRHLRPAA